jgi:hypothetical protein
MNPLNVAYLGVGITCIVMLVRLLVYAGRILEKMEGFATKEELTALDSKLTRWVVANFVGKV